jgi:hypothetical protein
VPDGTVNRHGRFPSGGFRWLLGGFGGDVGRSVGRYSAATGIGFSIGTPIMLPYSVHDPS